MPFDGVPKNTLYYIFNGSSQWKQVFLMGSPDTLRWRHNELDGVSDHQPHDCLFNRLFGRRSKKTSKLRVTGLCAGKSPGTGESPTQKASKAENVSIWWRRHENCVRYRLRHIILFDGMKTNATW